MQTGFSETSRNCTSCSDSLFRRRSSAWLLCLLFFAGRNGSSVQISPGDLSDAHKNLSGPAHCTDCHDRGKRPPEFLCMGCHREIGTRLKARQGFHAFMVKPGSGSRACILCHSEHNGRSFKMIRWESPLNRFDHEKTGYHLEGRHTQTPCEKCHQPAHISQAARRDIAIKDLARTYLGLSRECITCHEDNHRGQLSQQCERCHEPDTWKNLRRFNHSQTRFPLDRAHEKVSCEKCHEAPMTAQVAVKYAGIPFEDCTPCHKDPHGSAFHRACRTCHDALVGWKSSKATAAFNHSETRYPLSGKHTGLSCVACHSNGKFNLPVAFAKCTDCHKKDPHRGQFTARTKGGACNECHTIQGFKPSTFDAAQHNATGFPLKERHFKLQCSQCHKPDVAGIVYKIRDFSCVSCHQDIHYSQFALQPFENHCDRCHTQTVFKPSTYTIVHHANSRFPLAGAHAAALCEQCHKPDAKPVKFRFEDQSCTACHEDPHKKQFAGRMNSVLPDGTAAGCQICHTVNSWKDLASFEHASTKFPLEGAHREAACGKCHKPAHPNGGIKDIRYDSASRICADCHEDPHDGQFAKQMAKLTADGSSAGCRSCHIATSWKELPGFDHSATSFPLKGGHREVACGKCHPVETSAAQTKKIRYASTPGQCAGCHEDVHGGQFFKNPAQRDCSGCHNVEKWKPSTFDHARQSNYKLEGAHRDVACRLCHTHTKQMAGKEVVLYKPTARECSACHESETTGNQP